MTDFRFADVEGLASEIFEFSHQPSLSDDEQGMQEARQAALRWLDTYSDCAAHDAEVAANALRDAAEKIYDHLHANYGALRDYLTTRADRIEREATNHNPEPTTGPSSFGEGDRG